MSDHSIANFFQKKDKILRFFWALELLKIPEALTFKGVDTNKILKVTNDVKSLLNIIGHFSGNRKNIAWSKAKGYTHDRS